VIRTKPEKQKNGLHRKLMVTDYFTCMRKLCISRDLNGVIRCATNLISIGFGFSSMMADIIRSFLCRACMVCSAMRLAAAAERGAFVTDAVVKRTS
jgi:hypothetical protein